MKINLARLISGAGSVVQGALNGRLAAQQENDRQQQSDYQQYLGLANLQGQQQQQDRQNALTEANEYGTLLQSPYLDQNTGQGYLDAQSRAMGRFGQPRQDPYANLWSTPYVKQMLQRMGVAAPMGGAAMPPVPPATLRPLAPPPPGSPSAGPRLPSQTASPPAGSPPNSPAPGAAPPAPGAPPGMAGGVIPAPVSQAVAEPTGTAVPAAAAPPGAPPAGAAPAPHPGGTFVPATERQAQQLLNTRILRIIANADANNDDDTGKAATVLQMQLARRQISTDDALKVLDSLETTARQGAAAGRNLDTTRTRLGNYVSKGMIADPHKEAIGKLYGQLEALGAADTPAKRKQAAALLQQLGEYESAHGVDLFQPDAQSRAMDENRQYLHRQANEQMLQRGLDDLRGLKGKDPATALRQMDALNSYFTNPDEQKLGINVPPEFNPAAATVKRTLPNYAGSEEEQFLTKTGQATTYDTQEQETPAEVEARRTLAAAQYTDDPAQKTTLLSHSYAQLSALVRSQSFQGMKPGQQQGIVQALNDVADQLGIPSLPADLSSGLTPYQKQSLADRDRNYKLSQQKWDLQQQELNSLMDHRDWLENQQQAEFAWRKQHTGKGDAKQTGILKQIDIDREALKGLTKRLDEMGGTYGPYGSLVAGSNSKLRAEGQAAMSPLLDQANEIKERIRKNIALLPGGKQALSTIPGTYQPGAGTGAAAPGQMPAGTANAPNVPTNGPQTGQSGQGPTFNLSMGGRSYQFQNPYPNLVVPTPGAAAPDYQGHFGHFNQRVLQIAMHAVETANAPRRPGQPDPQEVFVAKFPDRNAAALYLWEARFKLQNGR